jgi:hypothetical protein
VATAARARAHLLSDTLVDQRAEEREALRRLLHSFVRCSDVSWVLLLRSLGSGVGLGVPLSVRPRFGAAVVVSWLGAALATALSLTADA